jgi:hypothetical protein
MVRGPSAHLPGLTMNPLPVQLDQMHVRRKSLQQTALSIEPPPWKKTVDLAALKQAPRSVPIEP